MSRLEERKSKTLMLRPTRPTRPTNAGVIGGPSAHPLRIIISQRRTGRVKVAAGKRKGNVRSRGHGQRRDATSACRDGDATSAGGSEGACERRCFLGRRKQGKSEVKRERLSLSRQGPKPALIGRCVSLPSHTGPGPPRGWLSATHAHAAVSTKYESHGSGKRALTGPISN